MEPPVFLDRPVPYRISQICFAPDGCGAIRVGPRAVVSVILMATTSDASVSFTESDTRSEEMHSTIETWVEDLVAAVDDAQASEAFQAWLDAQSQFHDYSYRNTLLIKQQCPEATRVAGYRTWQEEFDRHVKEGESAIWIWAPIIAKQCPECENSPSYHEDSDCGYDETDPEEWSRGLVGFNPAPVFDVSQTEGEPLPELETGATGDGAELVSLLVDAAPELDVRVRIRTKSEWSYGEASGVCTAENGHTVVAVRDRQNRADLACTLIHEFAHALLHVNAGFEDVERSKREVEAEAVAYIVGRYFGLDTSGSAFYLAAWESDDPSVVRERLGRISRTTERLIDVLED
jgi:hypothetical protein